MEPTEYPVNASCCHYSVVTVIRAQLTLAEAAKERRQHLLQTCLEKGSNFSPRGSYFLGLRIDQIRFVEARGLCAALGAVLSSQENWKNSCFSKDRVPGE